MRIIKITIISILFLGLTFSTLSQTPKWVEMMNDPGVNFYDVQKEAEDYFSTRDKGKGSGYKQFQRWEYFIEQRVYPHGERTRINSGIAWTETQKFKDKYSDQNSGQRNNWTEMGPKTSAVVTGHWSPGVGRIDAIEVDPNNSNIIFCGSPSGGLWKTTDGGNNWQAMTDYLPIIGISGIAVDPNNSSIVYIATGDKDASAVYSIGVLKSIDGGITWNITGLDWDIMQFRIIHKILIHPSNSNILFAATSNGLYKTVNAGLNWSIVLSDELEDLEFKPGDPSIMYGAGYGAIFKSINSGDSFSITSASVSGRAQITVTDANPNYLYVMTVASGIYRSTDSGDTYSYKGLFPDNGNVSWYALSMAASHTNAEQLHVGEFETWVSNNGGTSFVKTSEWTWNNFVGYVHCDIHEMIFYGGTIYCGSDGMISKSTDGGLNWTNLTEGIGIRQFYRIGCSATHADKVMGGSQDNGTSVMTNGDWHEWLGADGMECIIDWTNKDIVYGTTQNGNFNKSTNGGYFGDVNIAQPGQGGWITPYVMDYTDHNTIYVGNESVMKTINGMSSWTNIGNFGAGNIDAIAVAPSNSDYIYASKNENIWMTNNGGTNWLQITGSLPNHNITYITVHPVDEEKIAISMSGYTDGEKVYVSDDAGLTWTNLSGNLPNLPANCVVYHNGAQDGLYVGLDVGVFYIDNTFTNWISYFEGLPNVIVSELEIHYGTNKLRAGTYGRGLWEVSLFNAEPLAALNIDFVNITDDDNGDGIADPGETLNINVDAGNYGNLASGSAVVTLGATGPNSQYVTINTVDNIIGVIQPSAIILSSHSISISNQAPIDIDIELTFQVSDGSSSDILEYTLTVSPLPVINMNSTESFVCSGHFYDAGGEFGNYSDMEDYTLIVYPTELWRTLEIEFTYFDVEYEGNCDYDYLKIYDGASVADPLIGKYCGTNSPGFVTPTNADGALCFYFHSDEYVTEGGWEANIACDPPLGIYSVDDFHRIIIRSNPTTGLFSAEISELQKAGVDISVLNSFGQLIQNFRFDKSNDGLVQLDISDHPSGIYYLIIKTQLGRFSKKIVLTK